jgi:plasmid stability protein
MGAMTIRGLDDMTVKALKAKAKQDGSSVNAAMLKILKKELGLEKKRHTAVYHDLDHLAGTWDKKDYSEFMKNVEDFEKIDGTMWR